MSKEICLKIENTEELDKLFKYFSEYVKIPICLNCEKLFSLGFPSKDTGLEDYIICEENNLLCRCEHFIKVTKLHNDTKDGLLNIHELYKLK